ncbi:YcxB family protein [Massilia violaceinigra]|uniref:YcxB family protein n=1 Tax=Massilia violaceinigra TaxID=2045208 RepID=A0ABY4AAN0_9BURK|nr:YcxB family protein [Massilia violaceinigra]UOD31865.1 YcxB family protein [Massilia violaceinigra]
MRVEFELKFRDLLIFNIAHQLRSVMLHLFYAFGLILIFLFAADEEDILVTSLTALFAYLASWLIQLIFLAAYLRAGNNRTMLTHKVVELHHNALYEESRFARSYHFWPGIQKAARRHGYMVIYTTSLTAIVIPKRAFQSESEHDKFWMALNRKLVHEADAQ